MPPPPPPTHKLMSIFLQRAPNQVLNLTFNLKVGPQKGAIYLLVILHTVNDESGYQQVIVFLVLGYGIKNINTMTLVDNVTLHTVGKSTGRLISLN